MENTSEKKNRVLLGGLAVGLWIVTVLLGIPVILELRDMLLTLYVWLFAENTASVYLRVRGAALDGWIVFFLAILLLIFIVGSGEYHRKYFGQRRSWRLFAWSLGVELVILGIGGFI